MEKQGTIEKALHESLLEKTNFWQNVLERLVNVMLMLAKCNLPLTDPEKNFRRITRTIFSLSYSFFAVVDTKYIIKIFVHDLLVKLESKTVVKSLLKGKNNNKNSTFRYIINSDNLLQEIK